MKKVQAYSRLRGKKYTIYTNDQQLYAVYCMIMWNVPQSFPEFYGRLGGVHALFSLIGCIGTLMAESGLEQIMASTFAAVKKMLLGGKFPQNLRALRMVVEELLRDTVEENRAGSMSELGAHLEYLSTQSRTTKLWVDCLIKPLFLALKFVRGEREGDFHLHLAVFAKFLVYYFAAQHHRYARYGIIYLEDMKSLPDDLMECFERGDHVIRLKDGIWNAIW